MMAVDPKTFARFQSTSTSMPDFGGLYTSSNFLSDASYSSRQTDLNNLASFLQTNHIDYRLFSLAVPLVSKGPSN